MKQTLEEAARKYADEIYDPADRGILYRETQDDFIAGAKWHCKAINRGPFLCFRKLGTWR